MRLITLIKRLWGWFTGFDCRDEACDVDAEEDKEQDKKTGGFIY